MNRRGFLAGILAAGVAPAAIGSGVLMPLGKVWTPPQGLTSDQLRRVTRQLMDNHAPPIGGGYVVFVHSDWMADIDGFQFIKSKSK